MEYELSEKFKNSMRRKYRKETEIITQNIKTS